MKIKNGPGRPSCLLKLSEKTKNFIKKIKKQEEVIINYKIEKIEKLHQKAIELKGNFTEIKKKKLELETQKLELEKEQLTLLLEKNRLIKKQVIQNEGNQGREGFRLDKDELLRIEEI